MQKVGIVGYGVVGKHLERTFTLKDIDLAIYDKYLSAYSALDQRRKINECDLVFVSVPTPTTEDGVCDISAIEDVVGWITVPICIKSTIIPGTIDRLVAATGKSIVFSPEYVGETAYHKYKFSIVCDLVAIGGDKKTSRLFLELYKKALGAEPRYFLADAVTVELAKYMENCFFATKVAFVAQFYQLAQMFGADFDQTREIWVADTRVGLSHSAIIDGLGFGGRCLPKDLYAIVTAASGKAQLLSSILDYNNSL